MHEIKRHVIDTLAPRDENYAREIVPFDAKFCRNHESFADEKVLAEVMVRGLAAQLRHRCRVIRRHETVLRINPLSYHVGGPECSLFS